jgi:hypothetical protein
MILTTTASSACALAATPEGKPRAEGSGQRLFAEMSQRRRVSEWHVKRAVA